MKNPIKTHRLTDPEQLETFAKENKYLYFGNSAEHNIYNGFLFPSFRMKEVEEIYFYSTSLLWGHSSIGVNFIDYCFDKIDDALSNKKIFKIIVNTDINKLYVIYGIYLEMQMLMFSELFNSDIYFDEVMNPNEYKMFIVVNVNSKGIMSNNNKYYEILIGNKNKRIAGALKFDGNIKINEMSEPAFYYSKQEFNKQIELVKKGKEITKFEDRIEILKRDFSTKNAYLLSQE